MAKSFKTSASYKVVKPAKNGSLESGFVYFKNVPVVYAKVQELVKKYQSEDRNWELTCFIDADTMEAVEGMPINKGFAEVGKTKIKKGNNRGNLKYDPANEVYADYDGMFGFSIALPEFNKKGKPNELKVLGKDGKPITDLVGNGSICNIRCFAYRNRDEELCITLDTIVVLELVEYAGNEGGDFFDDELGVAIPASTKKEAKKDDDLFDEDDAPFDTLDDEDEF